MRNIYKYALFALFLATTATKANAQRTETEEFNFTTNVTVFEIDRSSSNGNFRGTELVPWDVMQEQIAQNSDKIIYGATNEHPIIPGNASIIDDIPSTFEVTYNLNVGTNLLGVFLYTNSVDLLRQGPYIGRFYAKKTGSGTVTCYLELIEASTTATNLLDVKSGASDPLTTATESFRLLSGVETDTALSAGHYLGIKFYAIKTGVPATTLTLYGGTNYLTSLETPSLTGYSESSTLLRYNETNYPGVQELTGSGVVQVAGGFEIGGNLAKLYGDNTFNGEQTYVYETNSFTLQFYAESNRWAYIDIYGPPYITNVIFISPAH